MDASLLVLLLVVMLGLSFEFVNGFHDAANAIATVVATRVLSMRDAVLMAAALNFIGALSGTAVATTVGKGLVDAQAVSQVTVAVALLVAIGWDLFTWRLGLPTSSSHALLFAVMGAAVATKGISALVLEGVLKVVAGLVYSPLIGFLGGALAMLIITWLVRRMRPGQVSALFGRIQLLSSAYMAFSHGGNDGQKTMGIIALALFSYGALGSTFYIPLWVMVAAATGMALGTMTGGWRIVKTMGLGIVHLQPVHGFAAETAAGTVIELATRIGMPISTTHTISSSILGVGLTRGAKRVHWGIAGNIVGAWVLTLPSSFLGGWLLMTVGTHSVPAVQAIVALVGR